MPLYSRLRDMFVEVQQQSSREEEEEAGDTAEDVRRRMDFAAKEVEAYLERQGEREREKEEERRRPMQPPSYTPPSPPQQKPPLAVRPTKLEVKPMPHKLKGQQQQLQLQRQQHQHPNDDFYLGHGAGGDPILNELKSQLPLLVPTDFPIQ